MLSLKGYKDLTDQKVHGKVQRRKLPFIVIIEFQIWLRLVIPTNMPTKPIPLEYEKKPPMITTLLEHPYAKLLRSFILYSRSKNCHLEQF